MNLEQLEHELAALPDEGVAERAQVLLLTEAAMEAAAAAEKRRLLDARIRAAHTANETLAEVEPRIAADSKWRADLESCRKICCDELLTIKSPIRDAHTKGVARNLTLAIRAIDFGRRAFDDTGWMVETSKLGALLREAGYAEAPPVDGQAVGRLPWHGSLPDVEHRLRELQARRDEAQRQLNAALRDEPAPALVTS